MNNAPANIRPELPDAAVRATAAGAEGALVYQGAGASGIVLCDERGRAFKVGRVGRGGLEDEAAWLATAVRTPGAREHVARFYGYRSDLDVIERECVARRAEPRGLWGAKLWEKHQEVGRAMKPKGWGVPEFKDDSYVESDWGWLLVDAGHALRFGPRLLHHAERQLRSAGPWAEQPRDIAWAIEHELSEGRLKDTPRVRHVLEQLGAVGPGLKGRPTRWDGPLRATERGYANVEALVLTSVAVAGVAAAPRLNTAIKARPLGEHVPPSAGVSLVCLVGGGLAHRAGYRKTGRAGIALGIGLAVGTLATARAEGGLLA